MLKSELIPMFRVHRLYPHACFANECTVFRPNHEFDRNLHWDERTVHSVAKHEDVTRVYDSSPEHF